MLYIDNIDDNSIRFGSAVGGGSYPRILPKTLQARADTYDTSRVWITNTQNNESMLNVYPASLITLEGTIYSAADFVTAFNNLCGGSISGEGGTVLATSYSTPGGGTVTNSTITFLANTLNSLTITCVSGTADITVGTDSLTITQGQSTTWTASALLNKAIGIDTTGSATDSVDYVTIGITPTTTTTTAAVTTTTTAAITTTTTTT